MMEAIESLTGNGNSAVQAFMDAHSDEYFFCEREKCIMRKTACLKYQKESASTVRGRYGTYLFNTTAAKACERANCWDCEQGRRIKEEMTPLEYADAVSPILGGNSTGQAGQEEEQMEKECIVEGCTETKLKARGMCKKHYDRWYMREKAQHGGKKLGERGIAYRKVKPQHVASPAEPATAENKYVMLSFDEHPELFKEVQRMARDELRPVDMQILYELKKRMVDGP